MVREALRGRLALGPTAASMTMLFGQVGVATLREVGWEHVRREVIERIEHLAIVKQAEV